MKNRFSNTNESNNHGNYCHEKALLSLSISALLLSPVVFAKDFVLTDTVDNIEQANWKITSDELGFKRCAKFHRY